MSKTPSVAGGKKPRSPKKPRAMDAKAIARAIVDVRLAAFAGHLDDFLVPSNLSDLDANEEGTGFDDLLQIVAHEETASNPGYWQGLDVEDLPYNHQRIGACAGFLVGLELGRRLGGAR
jgi:hypothetical protein